MLFKNNIIINNIIFYRLKKVFLLSIIVAFVLNTFSINSLSKNNDIDKNTLYNMTNDSYSYSSEGIDLLKFYDKTTFDINYIRNDGVIDKKTICLYRPQYVSKDTQVPLVFIAFYRVNDLQAYAFKALSAGYAVAGLESQLTGQDFKELTTNSLVFNNACLYHLKNMKGIDKKRIVVLGNSCGGYMALMLNALQLGITYTVANSPIVDLRFNIEYFDNCIKLQNASKIMPSAYKIGLTLLPIKYNFFGYLDKRWNNFSPTYMANNFSSKTLITHGTGDILVPVGQISKKYEVKKFDVRFPYGYFPYEINKSLEESIYAYDNSFKYYEKPVSLRYNDKQLIAYIFYDGVIHPENMHYSSEDVRLYDYDIFFETLKEIKLKDTQILTKEKIIMLLKRYLGKSEQLIAHVGVDDNVYGSLKIYQKEIEDDLSVYLEHKSLSELDELAKEAIRDLVYDYEKDEFLKAWEILVNIKLK